MSLGPEQHAHIPPLTPQGEVPAEDSAFFEQCLARAKQEGERLGFELVGTPMLTRSRKWGLVWRSDVRYSLTEVGVSRIVYTETSPSGAGTDVVAVSQNIEPLNRTSS
jgi:hypothetical protein